MTRASLVTGRWCDGLGVWLQGIVTDLVLRFLWTFSLIPADTLPLWIGKYMDYWMIAFLEIAELFRRSMWGCFRCV